MAKVETLDTFENNRAAAIEVDIFSDTNVRTYERGHASMCVLSGMQVCTSCIFNNMSLLCIYNIFICALLRMYFLLLSRLHIFY